MSALPPVLTRLPISAFPPATAFNPTDIALFTQGSTGSGTGTTRKLLASQMFGAPIPIGDITPNTGAFTALSGLVTATNSPTARTLADRAADLINAPDFGVKMDGTTSATAGLLASAAAANVLGGNVVHVPRGGIYAPGMTAPTKPTLWIADGTVLGTGTTPLALPGVVENWLSSDGAGRKRFTRTLGTSALDYATVEIARTLTHTGGAASSFSHNLVVSTTTNATASNGEWNFLTRFSNNSPSVLGVSAYVYGEQNVAANAGTSQGLISFIANYTDNTGLANPAAPSVTMELDQQVNGSDLTSVLPGTTSTGYRSFIHAAVVKWTGSALAPEVSRGLWFSGSDGGPGARLYSGVLFTDLDMNVAVDTSYATFSTGGPAIRLGAGQSLEFNGEVSTRRLSYVTADTALEYKVGGTTRWSVSDAGIMSASALATGGITATSLAGNNTIVQSGTTNPATNQWLSARAFFTGVNGASQAASNQISASDAVTYYGPTQLSTLSVVTAIGPTASGVRNGLFVNVFPTSIFNGARPLGTDIQAIVSLVNPNTPSGGVSGKIASTIALGNGVYSGYRASIFGGWLQSYLNAGATGYNLVAGTEVNPSIATGASAAAKYGIIIGQATNDARRGDYSDVGLIFSTDVTVAQPGWRTLIAAGSEIASAATATDSTLLAVQKRRYGGGSANVALLFGMDTRQATFTSGGGPLVSLGTQIDKTGNVYAMGITTTGSIVAKTATMTAVTIADAGEYTSIPAFTVQAPADGSGSAATVSVTHMQGVRLAEFMTTGKGYSGGDHPTIPGLTGGGITLNITVDGSGGITAVSYTGTSTISIIPANPVVLVGGTGTGATYRIIWNTDANGNKIPVTFIPYTTGAGYAVNDTLSPAGDTGTEPVFTVASVDAYGGILTTALSSAGDLTSLAAGPWTMTTVTGTGAGATCVVTYGVKTVSLTGGSGYPAFPLPLIEPTTAGSTNFRIATLIPTMTATQQALVLNSGGDTQTAGNLIRKAATADQSADVYIATAAGSRTIPNGCSWECLTPAAAIATFTTTMPAAPIDKQEVWISTTNTITTWTLSANTGQTINGAPTTLAANTSVMFRYNLATTAWFRMV